MLVPLPYVPSRSTKFGTCTGCSVAVGQWRWKSNRHFIFGPRYQNCFYTCESPDKTYCHLRNLKDRQRQVILVQVGALQSIFVQKHLSLLRIIQLHLRCHWSISMLIISLSSLYSLYNIASISSKGRRVACLALNLAMFLSIFYECWVCKIAATRKET